MLSDQDDFQTKTVEYIESAEKELAKLQKELQRLESIQRRVSDLQISIDKARSGAGIAPESVVEHQIKPGFLHRIKGNQGIDRDISTRPMHEKTRALILEFGRPMRDDEIAQEFRKRNWKLSEKSGVESLRVMFWKNKEIFKKVGERVYDVIERGDRT
jgi:hypothetical protein